ncbi:uncharacterized protein LOC134210947 [Armigeres subalbatus]|uniref:uncharacterized protein LOC134210947 n=1 Tax=Armigeres subalbatus TaxID=124917 RepID=UPI002ED5C75D
MGQLNVEWLQPRITKDRNDGVNGRSDSDKEKYNTLGNHIALSSECVRYTNNDMTLQKPEYPIDNNRSKTNLQKLANLILHKSNIFYHGMLYHFYPSCRRVHYGRSGNSYSFINTVRILCFLLVLPPVFVNATRYSEISILLSGDSSTNKNGVYRAPAVLSNGNTSSNLTLKIDAVQKGIDQLILLLNGNNSPHVINSLTQQNALLTGNFTPPTQGDKITELENEIKKMKEDITKLLETSNLAAEDRQRLTSLESSIEALQKILDNQRQEFKDKIEELDKIIQGLVETIKVLMEEIDVLKKRAAEEDEKKRLEGLPLECIVAVKSHDFVTAERKLYEINDDSKINFIINKVYEYQQSNFDLVLKFGDSISDKYKSFLVFKALNYETLSNGHRDAPKIIKLIESLRKGIINQQSTSSQLKNKTQVFENELFGSLKPLVKEKLKNSILNDHETNVETTTLCKSVYRISAESFRDLFTSVVNEVFGRIDIKTLLSRIRSHTFLDQAILGYDAVFRNIRYSNNDSLFSLAYYIKGAFDSTSYAELDAFSKSTLVSIRNSLPVSVKNAAFSSKVCIVNVMYPQNLYASGKYLHDGPRRHVFTAMPANNEVGNQEDHWTLIRVNDYFYIHNVAHREYMYSPSDYKDFKQGKDRRKVFTWTAGNSFDSCRWYIVPNGNYVKIKSVERSEYLYTSNTYTHNRYNQKMFTWIPGEFVGNGLWSIADCSGTPQIYYQSLEKNVERL